VRESDRLSNSVAITVAACVLILAVPSLAKAGTVQLDLDPGGPHVTFTAAGGETNHLLLFLAPGGYRVVDLGVAITPGTGCSAMSSSEAFCAFDVFAETPSIDILLGDQNDFASVAGTFSDKTSVDGEGGNDEIELSAGCELSFDGPCGVVLLGGAGDDTLRAEKGPFLIDGGPGGDSMQGGFVDYRTRVDPVTVDGDGVADDGEAGEGDNVFPTLVLGGSGNDSFTGGVSARGGGGDDTFIASGSRRLFIGQAGDDGFIGSPAYDACEGGPGEDQMAGGGGSDDLSGGGGADTINGGPGRDGIFGESGNDRLIGGPERDFISGGAGNDQIRAKDGIRDRLVGGTGFDRARIDRGLDSTRLIEAFF
jgi:Ca2+-binding RTX toxin-like protein